MAGRVIELVTKVSYEQALRNLLIDPLGLAHSRFFTPRQTPPPQGPSRCGVGSDPSA